MSNAWTMQGEYMESCNCDYLCPCIFTNPQGEATHEHCYAFLVFRVDNGECDGVNLAGTRFALVIRSGRVMADGDWVFAVVVDAPETQREALTRIVSGESGGVPGLIRQHLVTDFRGALCTSIELEIDGQSRIVSIPDVLSFAVDGVLSRNDSGEPIYLDNTSHPANSRLALAQSRYTKLDAFGLHLDLDGAGNNGHFAPFSWSHG